MARERMVTRTVNVTEVDVMMVDISNQAVSTITVEVGGGITDNDALLKAVKRIKENATQKCVAITGTKCKEILYGMPEADFIKAAKVLPPRTKIEQ